MTEVYGSIVLGGDERNAESLGLFVAWLVCSHLLSVVLERSFERSVTRVRMHEMTGPEFLTTVLDGELREDQLSKNGGAFTAQFLGTPAYREMYDSSEYEGDNEWARYAEVAPRITEAFSRWSNPERPVSKLAKVIPFPRRRR